jgi:hypothetical protein
MATPYKIYAGTADEVSYLGYILPAKAKSSLTIPANFVGKTVQMNFTGFDANNFTYIEVPLLDTNTDAGEIAPYVSLIIDKDKIIFTNTGIERNFSLHLA